VKESYRPRHVGLRVIGVLKLFSGATALLVGIGVFRFLGHDPGPHAERIMIHLGLDPNNHFIQEVLSRITGVSPAQLRALEIGTFFYAALHTVEGIGLILGYHWAEYLVIVATGSLIPFEIYEIVRKLTYIRAGIFVVNVAIVIYLIITLRKDRRERLRSEAAASGRQEPTTAPMRES
jgi:uncharacterized membrane protein (DUF2068 family)